MSDEDFSHLPPLLAEIAQVAGLDAALRLMREKGGTQVYIPARASDDHWLVACVGREAADRLCAHFCAHIASDAERSCHGEKITLSIGAASSRAQARRRALQALEDGASNAEAARAAGVHQRTVEMLKARLRKGARDKRQGNLF